MGKGGSNRVRGVGVYVVGSKGVGCKGVRWYRV